MTQREERVGRTRVRFCAFFLALIVAAALTPAHAWCHVTDTMPDAVAEMEYQILLDFQPEKVDVRNKLAMVLFRKQKFKEAEAELRTVLATDPANFNALDGLGLVMTNTGRAKEAVAQFLAAIGVAPQDVMVHYHLGQAYVLLNDSSAADKSFSKALELAKQPSATPLPAAEFDALRKAQEENRRAGERHAAPKH
ncbi:MAG: tetratricopeptide repeat protein [Desulfobulbaceae bacterium]|nr:tetratricopeptide repeat protein [Desulfobulbaceae bacterium]